MQAGLLSREISVPECPRGHKRGRQYCQQRYREPLAGSARSENHGMYGTFMRENRESPWPPVRLVSGRAAQGTLRR